MPRDLEARTEEEFREGRRETPQRIEILYASPSVKTYYLIPVYAEHKEFWEPKNVAFLLKLDTGNIITHSTGQYISQGLKPWFREHGRELKLGESVFVIERLDHLDYSMFLAKRKSR